MLDPKEIFPIGIGTWGIGGFAERNLQNDDEKQVKALLHSLNKGMNLIEATWWYAEGYAVTLLDQAIRMGSKKRKELFLSSTVYPYRNPTIIEAEKEIETVLKTFNTHYLDIVVFSLSSLFVWGEKNCINLFHRLLKDSRTRYVGVTNFNKDYLKKYKKEFGEKLFSHEVTLSFEIRENIDEGAIPFADQNNIKNIIFQPLRRNRTFNRKWPLLVELSNKYGKSQNQILLNWLVSKGYFPLVKSETFEHIDNNLQSLSFQISIEDLEKIDTFRPTGWKVGKIDWFKTGDGIFIASLPNEFDGKYKGNETY